MTTLNEVIQLVDRLSPQDRHRLRDYIDGQEKPIIPPHPMPVEERIRRFNEAATAIREDMMQEELDRVIADMNAEYIEPLDIEGLMNALQEIREGMTSEEFAIIEKAMND